MEQLLTLTKLLNSNQINWALGGSTLLKLRGIDIMAHDIDIMIHESDFEKGCRLLADLYDECEVKESTIFKTKYYRKFNLNGIEIDCMCGMSVIISDTLFEYPFDYKEYNILYKETSIPLCYIEDWYVLYHVMPNRESKVKVIEEYFTKNSINKDRINYLFGLNIPKEIKQLMESFIEKHIK